MTRHNTRVHLMANAVAVFALVITAWSVLSPLANGQPPLAKAPFNAQQAKTFQEQWAKHIGKELVYTNSIGMKRTLLPPGEFVMGVSEKDTFR